MAGSGASCRSRLVGDYNSLLLALKIEFLNFEFKRPDQAACRKEVAVGNKEKQQSLVKVTTRGKMKTKMSPCINLNGTLHFKPNI